MDCQTIIVNYTHPDRDTQALNTALELAYRHESELTLLHSTAPCRNEACERHYLFSEEELIQQVNKANGYGVPVTVKIVEGASPLDDALSQLAAHDLMVVGDSHAACFGRNVAEPLAEKVCYPSACKASTAAV